MTRPDFHFYRFNSVQIGVTENWVRLGWAVGRSTRRLLWLPVVVLRFLASPTCFSLISSRNDYGVIKIQESSGKLKPDAACPTRD